ncbi:MAG TPA: hypothetical protein VHT49_05405 [Acidimicrobiales bacterium]|nr:hypothetical protein [Acidimicrobiales bacterium]
MVTWTRRGVVVGGLTGAAGTVCGADDPAELPEGGDVVGVVVEAGFWLDGAVVAGVEACPGNERLT